MKGAGTLVKRGTPITRHDSYATVDVPRLKALIEASFGRTLAPDYLRGGRCLRRLPRRANTRGAAIFPSRRRRRAYLSKFSVEPQAQGEGMGYDLWSAFCRDFPKFFWRTRHANPIVPWYLGVADGMLRRPLWHVLWRGLEPEKIVSASGRSRRQEAARTSCSDFVSG